MLFSIDILLHRHHRRHLRPSQATKFLFPSFRGRHRASVDGPSPGTRCFCSFSSISAHPSTQGLFCFRIYRLSGNVYTTGLTSLLSTFRVSAGMFLGYHAFRDVPLEPAFLVFQHEWDWLVTTAFAVGAPSGSHDRLYAVLSCQQAGFSAGHGKRTCGGDTGNW